MYSLKCCSSISITRWNILQRKLTEHFGELSLHKARVSKHGIKVSFNSVRATKTAQQYAAVHNISRRIVRREWTAYFNNVSLHNGELLLDKRVARDLCMKVVRIPFPGLYRGTAWMINCIVTNSKNVGTVEREHRTEVSWSKLGKL